MIIACAVILLAASYRIVAAWNPELVNFSPLMALAFCGGVYFRNAWLWLVPFAALSLSDLYLNAYYSEQFGYTWSAAGFLTRSFCFAAALALGWFVSRKITIGTLLAGTVAGALFFYLVTNTASWVGDSGYAKSAAGWWQAMTVGHPQFPPTWLFFRNSLISDLVFTSLFALAMETAGAAKRAPGLAEASRD